MLQNLKVSSPAPVTIVVPSGFIAKYKTLYVCPVNVSIFYIFGIVQTFISFNEYPCVLTSSFTFLANIRLQTCEPTFKHFVYSPFIEFQNLMVLSAVPPPETKRPCWWGDQARAFTAAECFNRLKTGAFECGDHMLSLLSLPPEASCCWSKDHLRPQTYCLCPTILLIV